MRTLNVMWFMGGSRCREGSLCADLYILSPILRRSEGQLGDGESFHSSASIPSLE